MQIYTPLMAAGFSILIIENKLFIEKLNAHGFEWLHTHARARTHNMFYNSLYNVPLPWEMSDHAMCVNSGVGEGRPPYIGVFES